MSILIKDVSVTYIGRNSVQKLTDVVSQNKERLFIFRYNSDWTGRASYLDTIATFYSILTLCALFSPWVIIFSRNCAILQQHVL